MWEKYETEEEAADAIAQDPEAVEELAVAAGMSEAVFREEIEAFRDEMGAHFERAEEIARTCGQIKF